MPADHKEIAFKAAIERSLLTHGGFGRLFAFLIGSQLGDVALDCPKSS
jgi:hypothetical protein